jgi:3-methyladenine DNA glycosylase AlkC
MAERMKDSYGPEIAEWVGQRLAGAVPDLDAGAFAAECMPGYEDLELMDRARRITDVMAGHLPADPAAAVTTITASLGPVEEGLTGMQPFRYLPFVLYVGKYGLGAFEESMAAQYELTRRFTAEFSIRPFLIHHQVATLARLGQWAGDPDPHVRRLVSEGTRPRLPWAPRLPAFIADPAPVLALLELLRDDPSEYVRRSVANNLNDISKDHPEVVVELAQRWWADGDDQRRRLLRHALRTLVKRGDQTALEVLGHAGADHLVVRDVSIEPADPWIGGSVRLTATVVDTRPPGKVSTGGGPATGPAPGDDSVASGPAAVDPAAVGTATATERALDGPAAADDQVAVDFVVHFVKANGSTSARVFKGAVRVLGPGGSTVVTRSVSLAQQSTRTHHPGVHRVEVQVNGRRSVAGSFLLGRPG